MAASRNERNIIAGLSLAYNVYCTLHAHYEHREKNDKVMRYLDRLHGHIEEARALYRELDGVDVARVQEILNEYQKRTLEGDRVGGVTLVNSCFRILHSVCFRAEKGDYVWNFRDPVKRTAFEHVLDDLTAIKNHIDRRLSYREAYEQVERLMCEWWRPAVLAG